MILAIMNLFTGNKLVPLLNLLIFVLLLPRLESGQIRCMEKERQALLVFKEGLKDDFGFFSSWRSDDCCEWQGVRCSNNTSHVIALDLSNAHQGYDQVLRGTFGPSLLELQHLTYLDLSNIDFSGSSIPEFIGSLRKLHYLNLAVNGFVGVIPDQLGNLSNLKTLDLRDNFDLTVRNLKWLSHLPLLRHLDLSWVNLSKGYDWSQAVNKLPFLIDLKLVSCGLPPASFPLFNSSSMFLSILDLSYNHLGIQLPRHNGFFNYSSLISINLAETGLFGPIQEDFGKLKSLESLNLYFNELDGGIANSIGNLSSLRVLDLSYNKLNGTIPPSFGKLPKLEVLILSQNQFEGALPNFLPSSLLRIMQIDNNKMNGTIPESIGSLSELEDLDFSYNHFGGLVSAVHLLNHTKLQVLDLSGNSIVLEFGSDWVPPFNLNWIGLSNCKIGPHFPSWLRSQKHLRNIHFSGSGIDDAIPKWLWDLSSELTVLNLSKNYIHGILPDLSLKFERCHSFDLSSNNIEGPIPKLPANIVLLNLSKNKFQGSIISLCNNIGVLGYVDLSNNLLSGRLLDCLMQFKQLSYLNLEDNNFSGSIPSSIGLLSEIHSLQLRNNSLEGELPTSLRQCKNLHLVDIGQNKFTGNIPVWLGRSLSSLVILSLRSNQFNGSIPSEICYLNMIHILDLSVNNISGMIPKCLRNFTTMAQKGSSNTKMELGNFSLLWYGYSYTGMLYAEAALLVWKGIEVEYRNILGLVKTIDLSSNKLTGEIPSEITYLEGLVALNISRNNLHGKIPLEIGHLQLLQFLDLSRNQLSGMIPMSLSQLNSIGVLDLSNNNLSGKIPLSTQLQSFNASAYSGNPSLCGLPLPNLCVEDRGNFLVESSQDSQIPEYERFINPGFYAALGTGFTVGFWGTLGFLLLNSSWRIAYFRLVAKIQDWLYVTIVVNMVKVKQLLKK